MKLSIIIPVYNVEKYIRRCLESCVNQDIKIEDYEIIIVNDGSQDKSMEIVESFRQQYSNVRVINQFNSGAATARNKGLEVAEGEYIWFIDSDDHIEFNSIDNLLKIAQKDNLDVLCFNFKIEYSDKKIVDYIIPYKSCGAILKGSDFLCKVETPAAPWMAIFKRKFLNEENLRFINGIIHEDEEFTPRVYYKAKRIKIIESRVYYYYQREGSVMKSSRSIKRCRDFITIADSLNTFAIKNIPYNSQAYRKMLEKVFFNFSQSLAYYSPNAFPLSKYYEYSFYPFDTKFFSRKTKLKVVLANFSLRLYLTVYNLIKGISL